ncbi:MULTISPECIES: flagellar basal body L-ring protein FlgH [unclassified Massilia]|uniref:flagellar basal body L-ring protein FlgH n=1 Tax=unclassified Massilia TaxID=2609279 RepID=UPI000AD716FC|nr:MULTISPECIES: flagellar basal body L-ring protein FlgH [unclassified Massilia]
MNFRFRYVVVLLLASANGATAGDSLYRPDTYQALTSDLRARRIGDLITVMVYESASASSTANTTAARDANVGLNVQGNGKRWDARINAGNQMDGRGRTEREGKVLAQITVSIRAIGERGDLTIAGEQVVDINNERQQISIEGEVRPQDVSDTNVVLSTRIANARIRYSGQGDVSDKQRPAWWQRLLSLFGV